MKAVVKRGKDKGSVVTISQWCNDWFTIQESPRIFSPAGLCFNLRGIKEILAYKNNGILFDLFKVVPCNCCPIIEDYFFTFKKRKL